MEVFERATARWEYVYNHIRQVGYADSARRVERRRFLL